MLKKIYKKWFLKKLLKEFNLRVANEANRGNLLSWSVLTVSIRLSGNEYDEKQRQGKGFEY